MKKLIVSAVLAAAVALPATTATASEAGPPAGIRSCGTLQFGVIVWVINPKTGEPQDVVAYCVPIGPPPRTAS